MKIVINGKFFSQKTTGVQRVAREIVNHIENSINTWRDIEFLIVIPSKGINKIPNFKNIKVKFLRGKGNYFWEQIKLPLLFAKEKGDFLLNLCNIAPLILKAKNLVFIHDLTFLYHPDFFSWKFVKAYRFFIKKEAHSCKHIFTVSLFSKNQIFSAYRIPESKISIITPGISIDFSSSCFTKNELIKRITNNPFFFSVGSISKNKNIEYIINLANNNPAFSFVISGAKSKVFNDSFGDSFPKNVFYTGYISDEDLIFLYSKCYGFIFPSFSEGFGLPPLEAIRCGCRRIIVSNIPTMNEIFKNYNVNFIDPFSKNDNIISFSKVLTKEEANSLIKKYNWNNSVIELLNTIKQIFLTKNKQ